MEYEKINLTSKKDCGCKEEIVKKDCDCSKKKPTCKKIDINSTCKTPEYFQVNNYFSELVHEWEREAARYNLGIQELEGIEYVVDTEEQLTKVIFKYRKGHELITREFVCAPKGEKGEPGKDGRDGNVGPQGIKGEKGDSPTLNKVILTWVSDCEEEGGRFIEDCLNNGYNLELKLKKPEVFNELSKILDQINTQLTQFYAKKSDLLDYVKNSTFNNAITDILNKLSTAGAEYRLEYNEPWLYLTKNGKSVSSIRINTNGTGVTSKTLFTGQFIVFKLGSINSPSGNYNIYGSNWEGAGWQLNVPSQNTDNISQNDDYVWMAQCYVDNGTYGQWNYSRLTGERGEDGEDSYEREFIYKLTNSSTRPNTPRLSTDVNGRPYSDGWEDHPKGVDETNRWEWMSIAVRNSNGNWSEFTTPVLWSHYGYDGKDGDSVEYIFLLTEYETPLEGQNNPINWWQYENFQQAEYRGPDGFVWSDNPQQVTAQFPIQWVSKRKRVNNIWQSFSNPTIWNRYTSNTTSDPNIVVYVTPQLVTYISGTSNTKNIKVQVYYGLEELEITKIENGSNQIDHNNGNFQHTVNSSSDETFTVHFKLNDKELTRQFKLDKAEIPSSTSGTSPVFYDMTINPSVIAFASQQDQLSTNQVEIKIYKVIGEQRTLFNDGTLSYKYSWDNTSDKDLIINNGVAILNIKDIKHDWQNGDYLSLTLEVNNRIQALATIPCIKNAQTITSPCVIRNRGTWKSDITYVNEPLDSDNHNSIKYIDVVCKDALTLDENGELSNTTLSYYMPKVKETTRNLTTDDWQESYSLDFAFINTLVANIISAKSVQTNEVLVIDNTNNIVAGMTSGNKINNINNNDPIRIWAGTKTESEPLYKDLTTAPFRVYESGHVVANNVNVTGLFSNSGITINDNVTLPSDDSIGAMRWLIVSDDNEYYINCNNGDKIKWNDTKYTGLNFKNNGLYFIVKVDTNEYNVFMFTAAKPNCSLKPISEVSEKSIESNKLEKLYNSTNQNLEKSEGITVSFSDNEVPQITSDTPPTYEISLKGFENFNDHNVWRLQNNGFGNVQQDDIQSDNWIGKNTVAFTLSYISKSIESSNEKSAIIHLQCDELKNSINNAFEHSEDNIYNINVYKKENNVWKSKGPIANIYYDGKERIVTYDLEQYLNGCNAVLTVRGYEFNCNDIVQSYTETTVLNGGIYNDGVLVATVDGENKVTNLTNYNAMFKVGNSYVKLAPKGTAIAKHDTIDDAMQDAESNIKP